jgi:choline dehydrogenase-like flavoprotein
MHNTFEQIFEGMEAQPLGEKPGKDQDYGLLAPGRIIHEVGTIRMGNDPAKSVVNKYQQLHEADNVFVVDGGPFVSQADKNPTWTILALAWRTSDYIIDQLNKQNI